MKLLHSKIILAALLAMHGLALTFTAIPAQEIPGSRESLFGQALESETEKKLVIVPESVEKDYVDAEDLRDPFFLLRGYRENSRYVLEPGTTIDGIRFNSYADTRVFIESRYRESNFALEDVYGRVAQDESRVECLHCHRGIEQISQNHKFSCHKCHLGNPRSRNRNQAHRNLVSNPSDLKHAEKFCGKCHGEHIEKVKNSIMATANGIKAITRYAWGAKIFLPASLAEPAEKETDRSNNPESEDQTEKLQSLLDLASRPKPGTKLLVDDFLEKKCLRCHVQSPAPHRPGDYRSTGCAACHMIYANDGISLSRDRAIQRTQKVDAKKNPDKFKQKFAANSLKNKRGYPVLHKFTVAVPSVQCEHCHNNNGVGNEFEGLFGKPARPKPGRHLIDADEPTLYGRQHEFLLPDIHREKNMHCIDCHGREEIKGGTLESKTQHEVVKIRCEDCHGTPDQPPEGMMLVESDPDLKKALERNRLNPNLKQKIKFGDTVLVSSAGILMTHIKKEKDQWVLFSKVTGRKHIIPVLKDRPDSLAHSLEKHMTSMECHTCHARWSATEWGLHAVLDHDPDPLYLRDWNFPDPTLQYVLANPTVEGGRYLIPGMLNWNTAKQGPNGIEGDWSPGVWWNTITEGDWSSLIMGINGRGKYNILKPQYQFFVTERKDSGIPGGSSLRIPITADGKPGLIMAPHTPHTIRRTTRPCESCHSNPLAAGLGDLKREIVMDADQFLEKLKFSKRLLPQFQNKQMITETGSMIQTPLPFAKIRFLNPSEIESLRTRSDNYKAYRYLDLRSKNFPRLLVREHFPYDNATSKNEEKFGQSVQDEDAYYDRNNQRFTTLQTPEQSGKGAAQFDTMEEGEFAPTGDSLTNFNDINSVKEFSHETFPEPPVAEEETAPPELPSQAGPAEGPPADEPQQKSQPGKLLEDFLKDLKKRSKITPE